MYCFYKERYNYASYLTMNSKKRWWCKIGIGVAKSHTGCATAASNECKVSPPGETELAEVVERIQATKTKY